MMGKIEENHIAASVKKFRAWCKEYEEYIEDVIADGEDWLSSHDYNYVDLGEIFDGDEFVVEQSTGLKDKNGREIYEGDVVTLRYFYFGDKNKKGVRDIVVDKPEFEVVIDEYGAGFRRDIAKYYKPITYWHEYEKHPYAEIEVIGNIHDEERNTSNE